MDLWQLDNWKKNLSIPYRAGLRLHFDKSVHPEVREACKTFAKWLRQNYDFPLRVNVYIKDSYHIKTMNGEKVYGTCFRPFDIKEEPYIKIAAGDYVSYKSEVGRDDALASILHCIAHELTHYFQHINCLELTYKGEEIQATRYANNIVDLYSETRDHP